VVEAPNAQPTSLTPDELARVDPRRTTEEPISKDANVQRLIAVYFFRIYNVSWSVPFANHPFEPLLITFSRISQARVPAQGNVPPKAPQGRHTPPSVDLGMPRRRHRPRTRAGGL
jgi:hypothetical protein